MRSMWLVELFEGARREVKLRAHSFVCFEHARLRKSTVNIDFAGKRARESVENWILLVFISRLGWHLRVQGKTWGLMWLKQKKYFQQIWAAERSQFIEKHFRENVAAFPRPLQKNFLFRILLARKCFQCYLKTISDRIKDTFLWLPLGMKFISIQYLGELNLLSLFCNWRFATLINFLFS